MVAGSGVLVNDSETSRWFRNPPSHWVRISTVNSPDKSIETLPIIGGELVRHSAGKSAVQALKPPAMLAGRTKVVEGDEGVIDGAMIVPS